MCIVATKGSCCPFFPNRNGFEEDTHSGLTSSRWSPSSLRGSSLLAAPTPRCLSLGLMQGGQETLKDAWLGLPAPQACLPENLGK